MASIHLTRKATAWFKAYEKTCGKMILWKEFVMALQARFMNDALSDPLSNIKRLKQTGSLPEYLEQFDALLRSKVDLNEAQAVSHFLGGLKHEVELSVRLFRPSSLQDTYGLARVQINSGTLNNHCIHPQKLIINTTQTPYHQFQPLSRHQLTLTTSQQPTNYHHFYPHLPLTNL